MGRHNRKGKHGKPRDSQQRQQSRRAKEDQDGPQGYKMAVKSNEAFENYYKKQGIIPEGEWEDFLEHLRTPLPSTFRVAGFRAQAHELVKLIKGQYLSSVIDLTIDGKKVDPPKCLPWYPGEVAWQLNLDRGYIRKSDDLKKLHQFLVSETESGNISRQEAVSMLPPLVLDIKPHHKILDMCAAPGSKTAQLIEMLHADENIPIPEGFVVANDCDNKRCYLMVHQVKRLESPNFLIINHDASHLPNMSLTADRQSVVTYDRVLCDVPCTGDGTMRKNPDVWTKWNAAAAMNLHNLQVRILKRGLEVLAIGGRLVYSTCSFNPIEDEAVVAHLLQMCNGAVQLVDVVDSLPGLRYTRGVSSWKVMSRSQDWYESFSEVPERLQTQIRPSMFSPKADTESLHLDRCLRLLPHHQNTGGFFVAVLEKTHTLDWMKDRSAEGARKSAAEGNVEAASAAVDVSATTTPQEEGKDKDTENSSEVNGGASEGKPKEDSTNTSTVEVGGRRKAEEPSSERPAKKARLFGYKEDPFIWLNENDPVWPPIKEFYNLSEEFHADQLMVRCAEGKKRNLYYTSKAVKELVELNNHKVKFINMGVKMFSRSDSPYVKCDFRLVNDGISVVYPFIQSRIAEILPEDLVIILSQENPFTYKISEFARSKLEALSQGGMVFVCKASGKPNTPDCDIILTGWKGKTSCRSFLRRFERSHYLRLFGHELQSKAEGGSKEGAAVKDKEEATDDSGVKEEVQSPADKEDGEPEEDREGKHEVKTEAMEVADQADSQEVMKDKVSEVKEETSQEVMKDKVPEVAEKTAASTEEVRTDKLMEVEQTTSDEMTKESEIK